MKYLLNIFFVTVFFVCFLLNANVAFAQIDQNPMAQPAGGNAGSNWSSNAEEPATFKDLEVVFANVLGKIMALAGIVVFVMILWGGYQFMFSGGDPQKNTMAKGTLTWAIVGVLFLFGAWFILGLISEFTGVDVRSFVIPS